MNPDAPDGYSRRSFLSAVTATALTAGVVPLGCSSRRGPVAQEPALPPEAAIVAQGGRVLLPVVVRPTAAPTSKALAQTLAQQLSRMSRAPFDVAVDTPQSGVLVGLWSDFPELADDQALAARFRGNDPAVLQTYLLRARADRVLVVGASDLGLKCAVWDLLHRLGHRQFFPGPKWEIVPSLDKVGLFADAVETPNYYDRRIWYGFGGDAVSKNDWDDRNRMLINGSDAEINNAEGYGGFPGPTQLLKDHPEYLALLKGARTGNKLCLSNATLRAAMAAYAVDYFVKKPSAWSISMNPPDGPGWCECEPCVAMGQPSNRLVTLANAVAEGLAPRFPDKRVGILAYFQHADAPTIAVHPRVVVDVATAMGLAKLPIQQLVPAWAAKAPSIGIYDYYALAQWHYSMPARPLGGNLSYVAESIPRFYGQNARAFVAEAGESWGGCGLGFYVASRLLWNVHEDVQAIVDDFLTRAFGEAKEPMRRFYDVMPKNDANAGGHPGSAGFFAAKAAQMYLALGEARAATTDAAVLARIDDLVMYTRYVDLFAVKAVAPAPAAAAAKAEYAEHAYRIKDSHMIHWWALTQLIPEAKQLLKDGNLPPYGPNDARDLLAKGVLAAQARLSTAADAGAAPR
jgi:hypothetical protein